MTSTAPLVNSRPGHGTEDEIETESILARLPNLPFTMDVSRDEDSMMFVPSDEVPPLGGTTDLTGSAIGEDAVFIGEYDDDEPVLDDAIAEIRALGALISNRYAAMHTVIATPQESPLQGLSQENQTTPSPSQDPEMNISTPSLPNLPSYPCCTLSDLQSWSTLLKRIEVRLVRLRSTHAFLPHKFNRNVGRALADQRNAATNDASARAVTDWIGQSLLDLHEMPEDLVSVSNFNGHTINSQTYGDDEDRESQHSYAASAMSPSVGGESIKSANNINLFSTSNIVDHSLQVEATHQPSVTVGSLLSHDHAQATYQVPNSGIAHTHDFTDPEASPTLPAKVVQSMQNQEGPARLSSFSLPRDVNDSTSEASRKHSITSSGTAQASPRLPTRVSVRPPPALVLPTEVGPRVDFGVSFPSSGITANTPVVFGQSFDATLHRQSLNRTSSSSHASHPESSACSSHGAPSVHSSISRHDIGAVNPTGLPITSSHNAIPRSPEPPSDSNYAVRKASGSTISQPASSTPRVLFTRPASPSSIPRQGGSSCSGSARDQSPLTVVPMGGPSANLTPLSSSALSVSTKPKPRALGFNLNPEEILERKAQTPQPFRESMEPAREHNLPSHLEEEKHVDIQYANDNTAQETDLQPELTLFPKNQDISPNNSVGGSAPFPSISPQLNLQARLLSSSGKACREDFTSHENVPMRPLAIAPQLDISTTPMMSSAMSSPDGQMAHDRTSPHPMLVSPAPPPTLTVSGYLPNVIIDHAQALQGGGIAAVPTTSDLDQLHALKPVRSLRTTSRTASPAASQSHRRQTSLDSCISALSRTSSQQPNNCQFGNSHCSGLTPRKKSDSFDTSDTADIPTPRRSIHGKVDLCAMCRQSQDRSLTAAAICATAKSPLPLQFIHQSQPQHQASTYNPSQLSSSWLEKGFVERIFSPHLVEQGRTPPSPAPSVVASSSAGYTRHLATKTPLQYERSSIPAPLARCPELGHFWPGIAQWNFDIFELQRATMGHALSVLMMYIAEKHDFFNRFNLSIEKYILLVRKIEEGYNLNPYHNSLHAADVLQNVYSLYLAGSITSTSQRPALASPCSCGCHKHSSSTTPHAAERGVTPLVIPVCATPIAQAGITAQNTPTTKSSLPATSATLPQPHHSQPQQPPTSVRGRRLSVSIPFSPTSPPPSVGSSSALPPSGAPRMVATRSGTGSPPHVSGSDDHQSNLSSQLFTPTRTSTNRGSFTQCQLCSCGLSIGNATSPNETYPFTPPSISSCLMPIDLLYLTLAAAAHDIGHIGVTNQYLVDSSHPLALAYNDQAVQEHYHAATFFNLLRDPACNVFSNFSRNEYAEARQFIVDIILATDMKRHLTMVSNLQTTYESKVTKRTWFSPQIRADRLVLLELLVHASDVANPTKPALYARKWAEAIRDEWFNQAAMERAAGLPVTPMMEPSTFRLAKSQIGFIDFVVAPLFEAVAQYTVLGTECMRNIEQNRLLWIQERDAEENPVPSTPNPL